MSKIYGKLFGTPKVTKDEQEVLFPYGKVKALFYYLLINKQASREELAGMLWAEEDEDIAKKNLRNAIYKIKKAFDEEVIISPKKSVILLNPEMEIKTDVDEFLSDKKDIKDYEGELLQGFFVKNAEEFENWLDKTREHYKSIYISSLYEDIASKIANGDLKNNLIEKYARILIRIDEFDEKAYRVLMNYYKENSSYSKALELYNKLTEILDKELGITPDEETTAIFDSILDKMNSTDKESIKAAKNFFYGRCNELRILENNYNNFIKGTSNARSIIIKGEAGIGKSRLKERFLEGVDTKEIFLFETNCYQLEKEYILKPWNSIIYQVSSVLKANNISIPTMWEDIISNVFPEFGEKKAASNIKLLENLDSLKCEMIAEALLDILKKITVRKKIIMIFDDIQWMDNLSLLILSSIILHANKNDIMFIGTCRNEYDENIDNFITTMKRYEKIHCVNLERFNLKEVESFVSKALPQKNFSKEVFKKVYDETEGNAFFITEYLNILKSKGDTNIMSVKMQDVLQSRFLYISEEGKKILNIASLFFDEAPLEIIKNVTQKDELEIIDIIEELTNRFILKEVITENGTSFKFTHQKLREFVYLKQSEGRKRILHNKIASILEKQLKNDKSDINTYHKLIYHFSSGDNELEALRYRIKSLSYYLNFSHELFPILFNQESNAYKYAYFSKHQTEKHLKDLEKSLKEVKKRETPGDELKRIEISYLHIRGRYLIREGNYDEGTIFIKEMIEKSVEIRDNDYALEGYKQMIYYCIQTNDTETMVNYIDLALNLAVECNYHKEIGILLRLKGLYNIMCGKYDEAEKLLNESINIFNVTKQVADKYALNIAAAYNYIGEIRRYNMKFSEALSYFDKALSICENKNALVSLSIFNINAGLSAFDMGDYDRAKEHFEKAYNIFGQLDSIWKRSMVEAFLSLLNVKEGNYTEALEYLKNADMYSGRLKNPQEFGIVYRVKAEIKAHMSLNETLNKVFSKYLDKEVSYYCDEAIKYLKEAGDKYSIEVIEVIKRGN